MKSSSEDLCLSSETDTWFVFGKGKIWGKKQNRIKRKRKYRMGKRYDQLLRLSERHKELELLESQIGSVSEGLRNSVLSSSFIEKVSFKSYTYGKSDRIDYIADLLLNPLYDSKRFLNPDKKQECICLLYTTCECPCTISEQNRIIETVKTYFGLTPWQLFTRQCKDLDCEIELEITYITI